MKQKRPLRRDGFTFKQFFVGHDRCAMKVGTDGVLLGAWAQVSDKKAILDIGCGSGLIALMLAQRTDENTKIDAVELDTAAALQAQDNSEQSPWQRKIGVYQQDIADFAEQYSQCYDLIVSNPPYFEPAVACRNEAREQARYTGSLTHRRLLQYAEKLITADGLFCVVLPYAIGEEFETMACCLGWFSHRRVNIRDRQSKPLHRMLLAFSRKEKTGLISELTIRQPDGAYTREFQQLVTDFYLYC
ncbi:tRNA(1)(Val) (adenine(37)-N(6))-methyltransferase TrmN [Photorhabdus namnaonensis]|uniref:tRNA1(Val) (adenine(37)-N6)-methyltransferase n=1 Tax=Photorhabdus namnaonensis TaxID=1851568 RepID=A0A1B8YLX6_9GAMM|nr:tRNA1(Val) (adenine(37)-N6)-methyltransferase [Photorhabdus namnaonensis]OCA56007.1 tRNA1(Val) (adenine(37)-N6)-methyltransferase [Photorhabdus namnaonensis]